MSTTVLYAVIAAAAFLFLSFIFVLRRIRRCPPDKILVVYGKGRGKTGGSSRCVHGGAAFIIPVIQDYAFLDLKPMPIDINLQGALSLQNIRVNTPATFTVGISTQSGVMENAAERLLGMEMKQIAELARDIIFGQMRVVLATMPIEEINADRDKLIQNITEGVEGELQKVGLRLINVNIQDITDESGYIDALGREAAARAINEAKVKVSEQERDGEIGSAAADRDRRVNVAQALATAVEGENEAKVTIANSNATRREKEAEAERLASAAEKVKGAQALEEAYKAEESAERQRAQREEATQRANVLVPAEIKKSEIETLAEAEAERTRRIRKGEADGTLFQLQAEADGLKARMLAEAEGLIEILNNKAEGFRRIVGATGDSEQAALLLVTEQLPELIEEQVKAISNLKIDNVTVWDGGRGGSGGSGGKNATADFLSGLVGSLPPLHELTKNVGVRLPEYLGRMEGARTEAARGGREPGRGGGSGGGRRSGGEDDGGDGDDGPPAGGGEHPPGGGGRTAAAGTESPSRSAGGDAQGAATGTPSTARGATARRTSPSMTVVPAATAGAADDSPSLAALRRPGRSLGYGGLATAALGGGTVAGRAATAALVQAVEAEPEPVEPQAVEPRPVDEEGPDDRDRKGKATASTEPTGAGGGESATEIDAGESTEPVPGAMEEPAASVAPEAREEEPGDAEPIDAAREAADRARQQLRTWLASDPRILGIPGAEAASGKAQAAIDAAVDTAFQWADRVRDASAVWFHAEGGKWVGPESWNELSRAASDKPGLPVNLDRLPIWLPYRAITRALRSRRS